MTLRRIHNPVVLLVALALTALLLAGCGHDKDKPLGADESAGQKVDLRFAKGPGSTKITTKRTRYGVVLAGPDERTIYSWTSPDNKRLNCKEECSLLWLPVVVGSGVEPSGTLKHNKLGAVRNSGRAEQVTYNGYPLFFFANDNAPEDLRGQGIRSYKVDWSMVGADGQLVAGKQ